VVENDQARDVGEPDRLVARVAGYPLDGSDVLVPQVRWHGVDEGILARVDAGLRRELDPSGSDRAIGALDEIEQRRNLGEEVGNLSPRQVEQAHISYKRRGSTRTLTRFSSSRRHG